MPEVANKPTVKYITIPQFRPLYAWAKNFGPKDGPVSTPTPCPVSVIGELLRQTGKEELTIYEVVPTGKPKGKGAPYSTPVQLTLQNYTLPYDIIAGNRAKPAPDTVTDPVPEESAPVEPTYVTAKQDAPEVIPAEDLPHHTSGYVQATEVREEVAAAEKETTTVITKEGNSTMVATVLPTYPGEAESPATAESSTGTTDIPKGYSREQWAGMSNKAKKRAIAAAKQENNSSSDNADEEITEK